MAPISTFSAAFPPAPRFTDEHLPSLSGKIFIITGAASGVGLELAKMFYLAGGAVHIAYRSTGRCEEAREKIIAQSNKKKSPGEKGRLENMVIDLSDFETIKPAVDTFLEKEKRLDVLVHNAGIMTPPSGSKDKQGNDLEVGTNCLCPYLLTLLLEPIRVRTAALPENNPFTVRVVWVVSLVQINTPKNGMQLQSDGTPVLLKGMANYLQSKIGGTWLVVEFANRLGNKGVLSCGELDSRSIHPGLMRTELQRHGPAAQGVVMGLICKPPVYGAYLELYAGFSPEVKGEHNGGYLMAWGRIGSLPAEVMNGLKSKAQGGNGGARNFVDYCEEKTHSFV